MPLLPPDKSLGQHFLTDARVTARMCQALGRLQGKTVLEIGPGPGALTQALLAAGATVVAIEKDKRMLAGLEEISQQHNNKLTVHHGDALKLNYTALAPQGSILAGNLPYNVGTEITLRALQTYGNYFPQYLFMLQKEVIQRICATPGHKTWGRLGVWCDLLAQRQKLFDIAPGAFHPPPKVTSSVVLLTPLEKPRYDVPPKKLSHLLNTAFGQRRKMLRRNLKGMILEENFKALNIPPTARPEELSTEQLCQLARAL